MPDTGQSKCSNDSIEIPCPQPGEPFYGQDAQYAGPQRSYTKLDGSGKALPATAASWSMVRDNVTGLIWEVKTDDGSIHDKNNLYTWCDTNSATNGGEQGTCGDGTDTEDFISGLNSAAGYGGYHDWRLPSLKELSSLIDSDIAWPGPTVNTGYFPNTVSLQYWSSTTAAGFTSRAWIVFFDDGYVVTDLKSAGHLVRAVRTGP